MATTCPDVITRADYLAALAAFTEALGLDPREIYFPAILDSDEIRLPLVVSAEDGAKIRFRETGNSASVLASLTTIKVVD